MRKEKPARKKKKVALVDILKDFPHPNARLITEVHNSLKRFSREQMYTETKRINSSILRAEKVKVPLVPRENIEEALEKLAREAEYRQYVRTLLLTLNRLELTKKGEITRELKDMIERTSGNIYDALGFKSFEELRKTGSISMGDIIKEAIVEEYLDRLKKLRERQAELDWRVNWKVAKSLMNVLAEYHAMVMEILGKNIGRKKGKKRRR